MEDQDLRRGAEATLDHYFALSGTTSEPARACLLVEARRPQVWDANHARRIRARTDDEIAELLAVMDEAYQGMAHRRVVIDLDTPDRFEARLVLDGWELTTVLQHLLVGPLRLDRVGHGAAAGAAGLAIRRVDTEADWASMVALTRLDHLEAQGGAEGTEARSMALTRDMVDHRREKAPVVQAWLASRNGVDVGMCSSMPPPSDQAARIGLVEDLFVRPEHRGRGVAIALIAHCVEDARARGAQHVVIGSEPTDWPKQLYARLGFEPWWVQRYWMTRPG